MTVSLTSPDSWTRDRSTVTGGSARRDLSASAAFIASLNRSIVAEMPHTIGIGGYPAWPLTSSPDDRRLVARGLRLKPRCASSRTRYSVRSSSSIVLAIVSQIVHPCRSGRAAAVIESADSSGSSRRDRG